MKSQIDSEKKNLFVDVFMSFCPLPRPPNERYLGEFFFVFVITFKFDQSFWFFVVLGNAFESWSNLFWKSEKKLGYKRLQLCSWKKYFSKIWKGLQQGYFCSNFQLAYRGKFLIFFNTWKCARKLKFSILIMSKKNWYTSAYKCQMCSWKKNCQ